MSPARTAILLTLLATPGMVAGQEPREALLAADRAAANASSRCGLGCALEGAMAADALYLHAGMPVMQGATGIGRFLRAQSGLADVRIQWLPLHGEASADGTFGITWGITTMGIRGGPVRFGHYLTAWRHQPEGWRVAAHIQTALNRPGDVVLPQGGRPAALPSLVPSAALVPLVEADQAFSDQAGRNGPAAAFGAFAAPDAIAFGDAGELIRGPEAIRASHSGGPPAHWSWGPVAVRGADDGSLGATVGEAVITVQRPDGTTATFYSKYLTAWRRDASGAVRFISDAGNARPAP